MDDGIHFDFQTKLHFRRAWSWIFAFSSERVEHCTTINYSRYRKNRCSEGTRADNEVNRRLFIANIRRQSMDVTWMEHFYSEHTADSGEEYGKMKGIKYVSSGQNHPFPGQSRILKTGRLAVDCDSEERLREATFPQHTCSAHTE